MIQIHYFLRTNALLDHMERRTLLCTRLMIHKTNYNYLILLKMGLKKVSEKKISGKFKPFLRTIRGYLINLNLYIIKLHFCRKNFCKYKYFLKLSSSLTSCFGFKLSIFHFVIEPAVKKSFQILGRKRGVCQVFF